MDRVWKHLPEHLLDSVVERLLSPSDYLQFSLVCKLWYGIAKHNHAKFSEKMTFPMLLIATDKQDTWKIYNVMENKVSNAEISMPNKRYSGCSKGWLITVEENWAVTLVNPFLRVKGGRKKENSIIHLPPLPSPSRLWLHFKENVYKSFISADPVLNPDNCVVVIIYKEATQMAFIRLGKDATWTMIGNLEWRLIDDVSHFDGTFYAVDRWNKLLSFKITTDSCPDIKLCTQPITVERDKRYLVISDGKVLMVRRYFEYEDGDIGEGERVTNGFRIFEINFDKCEWIEKSSLGDVALFLGDKSSICVPIISGSEFQSDCIYFYRDVSRGRVPFERPSYRSSDIGVYNVRTRNISQPYSMHATALMKNAECPPVWVVPSFQSYKFTL